MAHFCARVRKHDDLPSVSIKDIYRLPTISRLAAGLTETKPASATDPAPDAAQDAEPFQTVSSDPVSTEPPSRASTLQYILCGAAQFLVFLGYTCLLAVVMGWGFEWITSGTVPMLVGPSPILAGTGALDIYLRAAVFGGLLFVTVCTIPILAKWLLIGRWKPGDIKIWSLGYLRFWIVKTLIRSNPLALLFAGSPLYTMYLRALGARIGRGVAIFSKNVPVCTDLLTIGAGTVIRKDSYFLCYRAHAGKIQFGPVTIGRDVLVGERTVLEVNSSMGDRAQLGHTSALHRGVRIPADERWHGSPAEPTQLNYLRVAPARCGLRRRVGFTVLGLLAVLLVYIPVAEGAIYILLAEVPAFAPLLGPGADHLTSPGLYLGALAFSLGTFCAFLILGLVFACTVPRLLNLFIKPDKVYPLFGFHYGIHRTIARLTAGKFYMQLFGDSSYVVNFLQWLGYDLSRVQQTGSNFGTVLAHESPYLSSIGSGTMVADGLSIMNAEYSNTSFRVSRVRIGPRNFLGNGIAYPPDGRTGDNCLLATKVMIPLDGEIREGTGLLGSPPFEIPRKSERDSQFELPEDERRWRLSAKNRYNIRSMAIFLFVRWLHIFLLTVLGFLTADLYGPFGYLALAAFTITSLVVSAAYFVLIERGIVRFRRLRPQFCSIYHPYFWWHERYWKLAASPRLMTMLNGTPFRNTMSRLLGVRIGKRVFDDGCGMSEKTLVTIGDDCTLNAGSGVQCHSQEDGGFKSNYSTLGSGVTLGVGAFAHYGISMGDAAVLDADAFLMKGAEVLPGTRWSGNPATEMWQPAAPAAPARPEPPKAIESAPDARGTDRDVTLVPIQAGSQRVLVRPSPAPWAARPVPAGHQPARNGRPRGPARPPAQVPPAARPAEPEPTTTAFPVARDEPAWAVRPRVQGELPGRRSAARLAKPGHRGTDGQREHTDSRRLPIVIAEASGSFVRDLDGNVFIDFVAGDGVIPLGHDHPELAAAPGPASPWSAFAEAQLSMLPAPMRYRMGIQACATTGARAVQDALDLCKRATGRRDVVSFYGGFFPVTNGAGPTRDLAPGVRLVPFCSCSQPRYQLDPLSCRSECGSFLERALTWGNGSGRLPAAVLISMMQGEGGVVPARRDFVQQARALTRRLGIPLVVDEVATGGGRTGTWFAFEQYDIEPDIVVTSKVVSGIDHPMAVVLHDARLGPHLLPTSAGPADQAALVAGSRLVDIVRRDRLLQNARVRGDQLGNRFAGLRSHPAVLSVRGRGLMWGVELAAPGDGRTAAEFAADVRARALHGGLIVQVAGPARVVLQMLPPLNVTAEVTDLASSILLHAIEGAFLTPPEARSSNAANPADPRAQQRLRRRSARRPVAAATR